MEADLYIKKHVSLRASERNSLNTYCKKKCFEQKLQKLNTIYAQQGRIYSCGGSGAIEKWRPLSLTTNIGLGILFVVPISYNN
jgi:hypothetical protein